MTPHQQLLDLLEQYKTGTVSEAEQQQLLLLIQSGTYNDLLKEDILTTLREQPAYAWSDERSEQVLDKIMLQAVVVSMPPRKTNWRWYGVAAAVLLVMVFSAWFLMQVAPSEQQPLLVGYSELLPGNNKAMLTLANGATVLLDSTATGVISVQQGTEVNKQKGQLIYSNTTTSSEQQTPYNVLATPRGGQYQVILPDGTKAWLNAASSLKYPVAFTGGNRVVELTGEGYFEVAQYHNKPFVVKVNGMNVRVLGTHFNIMAYPEEKRIRTTLLEGAVQLEVNSLITLLHPGEQGNWDQHTMKVVKADVEEAVAWKNGFFQLEEAGIETVMNQLSRWYNVSVSYPNGVPDMHFTAYISRNTSLTRVLEMLKISNLRYQVTGNQIIILGENKK